MAFLAFDAEDIIDFGKFVGFRPLVGRLLEIRRVAFQAPGCDGPVKVRLSRIARADGPLIGFREPGQGQLEQVILKPVDAGLAPFSRPDDDIERPGQFRDIMRIGRLIEAILFSLRGDEDMIVYIKPVGAVEIPLKCRLIGRHGG